MPSQGGAVGEAGDHAAPMSCRPEASVTASAEDATARWLSESSSLSGAAGSFVYNTAIGFTGDAVPRSSTRGATKKRKVHRRLSAHATESSSKSRLSKRGTPIATIATV